MAKRFQVMSSTTYVVMSDSLTKTEVNTDLVLHPSLVLQVVSECVCINKCIIYNFMNEVYSKPYEKSEQALVFLPPA